MKQWKRILFSVISLVWGFVSLDYLIYAFEMLTGSRRSNVAYSPKADGIYQLLGFGMFLLWFIIFEKLRYRLILWKKKMEKKLYVARSLTGSYRAVFYSPGF